MDFVAISGNTGVAYILDRQGKKYKQLQLPENRAVKEME